MTDPIQAIESRIAAGFAKIGLVLRHEAWRKGGERGLTPTQAQILGTIAAASDPLGVRGIAERLALTLPTVSEALSTLVEKALVTKERDPNDGRATIVKLTAQGRREAKRGALGAPSILAAATGMTHEQKEGLVEGLVAMIRSLEEQGLIPTSKMCVGCRYFRPHLHPGEEKIHHCDLLAAPIGRADLRLDCPDQLARDDETAEEVWAAFREGRSARI